MRFRAYFLRVFECFCLCVRGHVCVCVCVTVCVCVQGYGAMIDDHSAIRVAIHVRYGDGAQRGCVTVTVTFL